MAESALQLENPYQTPQAVLTDTSAMSMATLYVVSKKKLAILFLCTLGIYSIYWFYENWRRIKTDTGKSIWPVPRSIFNIFYAHALFKHIHTAASRNTDQVGWSYKSMAILYIVISILGQVAEHVSDLTSLLSLLLLPVFLNIFLKVQGTVNTLQGEEDGEMNSRFTWANWVWCVFGVVLWAALVFGYAEIFGLISIEENW